MSVRNPPPIGAAMTPDNWAQLLNAVYYMWDRLNRTSFQVGERTIYTGTGTPESNVTASVGDIYLRDDGGANTTLYVKESGAATDTGWAAI